MCRRWAWDPVEAYGMAPLMQDCEDVFLTQTPFLMEQDDDDDNDLNGKDRGTLNFEMKRKVCDCLK